MLGVCACRAARFLGLGAALVGLCGTRWFVRCDVLRCVVMRSEKVRSVIKNAKYDRCERTPTVVVGVFALFLCYTERKILFGRSVCCF